MLTKDTTVRNLLDKLGISDYLNTAGVTEVMINRPYECFIETFEGFQRFENHHLSFDNLKKLANSLSIYNQKEINFENPIQSLTLPEKERGHVMIPPSCEDETVVFCFRKPSKNRFTFNQYLETDRLQNFKDSGYVGELSKHAEDYHADLVIPSDVKLQTFELEMLKHKANRDLTAFFKLAIDHKLNICMVGGTGSGKTTFTKAIADLVPSNTRILTIEDTHELDLPNHPNHAHLFFKEHITAKQIVTSCLRLRPDRIFLTELRGDEAWDYLSALNTGHAGGLTSVHANDCQSVFFRVAQLAKESSTGQTMDFNYILNTVRSTIDIVCFFYTKREKV